MALLQAAGGMQAVVAAMRAHPGSGSVQAHACAVLAGLAGGSAEVCAMACPAGVVASLTSALRENTADEGAAVAALRALDRLACGEPSGGAGGCRAKAMEGRSFHVVMGTLESFRDVGAVQDAGFQARGGGFRTACAGSDAHSHSHHVAHDSHSHPDPAPGPRRSSPWWATPPPRRRRR